MVRVPLVEHARDGAGRARPVDPLYATRVVVLAKASSICGALFGGFALGLVVYLLTRSAWTIDRPRTALVAWSVSVLLGVVGFVAGIAL
ncbi:DUF3180 family protein, partial [Bacillus sp. S34]|nr:DUF3180 family protein [Bacillus sp. S34]